MCNDDIENLIVRTSWAIRHNRTNDQIVADLVEAGCSDDDVFLIYHAAKLLLNS